MENITNIKLIDNLEKICYNYYIIKQGAETKK